MLTSSKTTLYMCTLVVQCNRWLIMLVPWTATKHRKTKCWTKLSVLKWDSNLENKFSIIHIKYKTTTTQMKTTTLSGLWFNLLSSSPKSQNCFACRKKTNLILSLHIRILRQFMKLSRLKMQMGNNTRPLGTKITFYKVLGNIAAHTVYVSC